MNRQALTMSASVLLVVAATTVTTSGQPDPFVAMNALRAAPPSPAPDVAFQALDGRVAHLGDLRGRPVVLTFFTTW